MGEPALGVRPKPDLTPYVPRVTLEWLDTAPDALWRELDGTLAFADISGFTTMSERLARRGKAGAEEVTEVMNATFDRLLRVAYDYGGSLIKFGGDALLLFYDGDGHAARAARAAFGMRRELREIGKPRTSVGQVTLRMHVGVHSGPTHFFLVGDSHRELLITGPAATETVAMEAGAKAGEILLSERAAALVDERVLGPPKDGGRLLRAEPDAPHTPEPVPETAGLELARCVPEAVRAHVEAATDEPEHRAATIAFLQFRGTDDLLRTSGPAAVASALDELVNVVQQSAEEHGVCFLESDIDRDGGKIVLVAGAPQTAGHDEERMLRTVRAVIEAGSPLPIRIGVNRGRVFAGEVGASFRRTYTILGGTAALAARLMARAEPGQILTPAAVLERSRTSFAVEELPPLELKGLAEPVIAYSVGRVEGARETPTRRELPLVGREREFAVLGAALTPVRMGFGSFVELVGDPGIGKSRVVAELESQCADMRIVESSCEQYETSTAYFAFRDLLRSLLNVSLNGSARANTAALQTAVEQISPELTPWLPLLAVPLDVAVEPTREAEELQPAFRRARLHGVVGTLLGALLSGPTLLVFEDVHWMDEASSELLRHLGEQVSSKPWLVCATRRPTGGGFVAAQGVPPLPALTLRLEPLSAEAARQLAGATAEDGLRAHELEAITERAGGNPLFLQELVAAASRDETDVEQLPESVEAVVTSRIDELATRDRILLRFAAVLGGTFSGELVEDVLAAAEPDAAIESESWDRLVEFVERDPYTPGAFRFRHALFRDAAYEGLSYRRRGELHARAGEAYEARYGEAADEHAELLSLHFFRAEIHDKAWRYSLTAGERARAKFANVEAAEFYRRALDAAKRLRDLEPAAVARVWEALGDVCELAGLYTDAADAYRNARRLFGAGTSDEPRLMLKEGKIRELEGQYAEALRWFSRGFKAAEKLPSEHERKAQRVALEMAYAATRIRQGELTDCIRWCRKVVDGANEIGDLGSLAHAYYLMHLAYTTLGSPERTAFRGLALPIYEDLGDLLGQANVLNNLGVEAYYEGRWEEALRLYERSKEFRERIGDVVGAATITNNIAEIKADQGRLDEARELFEEALEVCAAARFRLVALVARSNLGRLATRAGRLDEAAALLQEALDGFREIRAANFAVEAEARLAEHALHAADHETVLRVAADALAEAEEIGGLAVLQAMLHRLRGYALAQQGDLDSAGEELDESLRCARAAEAEYEVALTLEARARIRRLAGDPGGADEDAVDAAAILERLGVAVTPLVPLSE